MVRVRVEIGAEQATSPEVVVLLHPAMVALASHEVVGRTFLGSPYWRSMLVCELLRDIYRARSAGLDLPAEGCHACGGAAGGIVQPSLGNTVATRTPSRG